MGWEAGEEEEGESAEGQGDPDLLTDLTGGTHIKLRFYPGGLVVWSHCKQKQPSVLHYYNNSKY